jgi:glycosyltransferase involved in cell wall biosynthesis
VARILFLAELLPYPLDSGAKIRAYYVLRHLAQSHQVTLLTFVRDGDRPEYIAHLEGFLERVCTVPMQRSMARNARAVLVSVVTGCPAIIAREQVGAMGRQVERLLATGQFDVVHADQIPMAQYGLLGTSSRVSATVRRVHGEVGGTGVALGSGPRRLLDQHNATFQIVERLAQHEPRHWKRALLRREAGAFARYEVEVCRRFDHVSFVSSEDRQTLLSRMGNGSQSGSSSVIPICVDTQRVQAVSPVATPNRVTYLGTMYWPPNVEGFDWFWQNVWAEVQAQVPDARLTCIGKRPPRRITALNGAANVEVLGYVPDLARYLAETAVLVVPLQAASGMRVKILHAWCWGVPVVSTRIGAEGIAFREGENLLAGDSARAFASAVVRVLTDGELRRRLRAAGRRWVEEHYDWHGVYSAWDEVYERLLRGALPHMGN